MTKFLPLGTVVRLRGGEHRLMIVGRLHLAASGKTYDYVGMPYPQGFLDRERIFMFDEENIDDIYYVGYQDIYEFGYRKTLEEKQAELEAVKEDKEEA